MFVALTPPRMAIVPLGLPEAVGVNVTLNAQLPPTASVPPQLLVCEKPAGIAPMESVAAALPLLVNVNDLVELVLTD
jgi:hypothetical protein